MTEKPITKREDQAIEAYYAVILLGMAVIFVLAIALLCLGPVAGLSVKIYNYFVYGG